jgi:hypothetical protein
LKDALPKELFAMLSAELSMVFGIPASILGQLIGLESSSYANRRADWQVFWDVTMTPLMTGIGDVINHAFLNPDDPEFGGIDEVCFDLSTIRALQEDEDALQERARKNFAAGLGSFEESRQKIGLDPEPVEGHLLLPPGTSLIPMEVAMEPKEEWTPAADILIKVLQEVTVGAMAPEVAKALLRVSFPSLDPADIDEMVDEAAAFEPKVAPAKSGASPSGPDAGAEGGGEEEGSAAPQNLVAREMVAQMRARGRVGRVPLALDTSARAVYERAEALRRDAPYMTMGQVARRMGIAESTYRKYRREFGG